MDTTRSFFPQNFAWPVLKITFFLLTREPEDLAICLFYTILLLLIKQIELYKIRICLKPRIHELKRKKHHLRKKRRTTQKTENLCRQEKIDCAKTRAVIGLKF